MKKKFRLFTFSTRMKSFEINMKIEESKIQEFQDYIRKNWNNEKQEKNRKVTV